MKNFKPVIIALIAAFFFMACQTEDFADLTGDETNLIYQDETTERASSDQQEPRPTRTDGDDDMPEGKGGTDGDDDMPEGKGGTDGDDDMPEGKGGTDGDDDMPEGKGGTDGDDDMPDQGN
ncbi:MAG: hypothetical protein KJO23_06760 [Bacteroidia bacterium]|nr:hypothetical protein [Bacteroidia bacterium]